VGLKERVERLEQFFCPASIIPIHVQIIIPGNRMFQGRVYRENQFLPGSDEPISGAVSCAPKLVSENRNEDGKVFQRCFVCNVPEG